METRRRLRSPSSHPLQDGIDQIRASPFRRGKRSAEILSIALQNHKLVDAHPEADVLWRVFEWLTVPYSLWPIDFEGLSEHLLLALKKGRRIDRHLTLLLHLIAPTPDENAQFAFRSFEGKVAKGEYETLVQQNVKFDAHAERIKADSRLGQTWKEIKTAFKKMDFDNRKGVIRRRLSQERNFKTREWDFQWRTNKDRFRCVFDALCHRWGLYGFEKDEPLPLKLSVNPTPFGTMIMIPRHWSFDPRRDLNWAQISRLHRAHGATREGVKRSEQRVKRIQDAVRVKALLCEAQKLGLRGERRTEYVFGKLGWHGKTDHTKIRRLVRLLPD